MLWAIYWNILNQSYIAKSPLSVLLTNLALKSKRQYRHKGIQHP